MTIPDTPPKPEEDRGLEPQAIGARHGVAVPRGQDPVGGGARGGRFGRMFPYLPPCDPTDEQIEALVACVRGRSEENARIPAGFTYFGQFIDHDITFDPMSSLQRDNDPSALTNFRTPRLDLDSLYGSGPKDQPYLYDWNWREHPGVNLIVQRNPPGHGLAEVDLQRNGQGRALIGDARNDENAIVAQIHLLFIRFHNKVVKRVLRDQPDIATGDLLAEAQRIVRWHYQWIVLNDYLPKLTGDIVASVLGPVLDGIPPAIDRRYFTWRDEPFMPVEFSGAAFRVGHSMVRDDYRVQRGTAPIQILRPRGQAGAHLGGFRWLEADLVIDWSLFFFEGGSPTPPQTNSSNRLDTILVAPLAALPPDGVESLARLNLQRGRALGLPSGPDVARAMSIPPLVDEELDKFHEPYVEDNIRPLREHLDNLPLWTYVLLEAKLRGNGGLNLGPVGGRIVAEVLVGLIEADPNSYLRRWPHWTPELSFREDGQFPMVELVRYVQGPELL